MSRVDLLSGTEQKDSISSMDIMVYVLFFEFDGAAFSELGVRSRKLTTLVGHRMGDQKFIITSSSVLREAR
jgi:hypothetical protein